MAIVYLHRKANNKEVFYVGIGKTIERAFQKKYRNKHWINITNKYEYEVEIVKDGLTWTEACDLEINLIKKYKRKCDGGCLCNVTIGGDGVVGVEMSEDHKRKISKSNTGKKRSIQTKQNISNARKGIVFSEEHRKNISSSRKGIKMPESFRKKRSELTALGKHPLAKEVIDLQTGIAFSCIKEACISLNCDYKRESQRLRLGSKYRRFEAV